MGVRLVETGPSNADEAEATKLSNSIAALIMPQHYTISQAENMISMFWVFKNRGSKVEHNITQFRKQKIRFRCFGFSKTGVPNSSIRHLYIGIIIRESSISMQ